VDVYVHNEDRVKGLLGGGFDVLRHLFVALGRVQERVPPRKVLDRNEVLEPVTTTIINNNLIN
jgi:hypothetical protein